MYGDNVAPRVGNTKVDRTKQTFEVMAKIEIEGAEDKAVVFLKIVIHRIQANDRETLAVGPSGIYCS